MCLPWFRWLFHVISMSSTFEEKCITCPLITKKTHHDLLQFHCLITTNHHIMILTRSSSINHFPLSLTINHHHIMFHMPNNGELKPPPVESYQITMFDHVCWSNTTKSLFSLVKKNKSSVKSLGLIPSVDACIIIITYPYYITIFVT